MIFVWLAPASPFPKSTTWQRGPTARPPNPPITISGFPAGTEILLRLCLSGISHPWVLDGCTKWEVIVCWHWDPERPARLASCFLVVLRHKACESHSLHTFIQNSWHFFCQPSSSLRKQSFSGRRGGFSWLLKKWACTQVQSNKSMKPLKDKTMTQIHTTHFSLSEEDLLSGLCSKLHTPFSF